MNVLLKEIALLEDILSLFPCHAVQINCRLLCDMVSHSGCLRDLNYIAIVISNVKCDSVL